MKNPARVEKESRMIYFTSDANYGQLRMQMGVEETMHGLVRYGCNGGEPWCRSWEELVLRVTNCNEAWFLDVLFSYSVCKNEKCTHFQLISSDGISGHIKLGNAISMKYQTCESHNQEFNIDEGKLCVAEK